MDPARAAECAGGEAVGSQNRAAGFHGDPERVVETAALRYGYLRARDRIDADDSTVRRPVVG